MHSVASPADALRRIDRRESYGAVVARPRGLTLVVAPAASAAVAQFLGEELAPELRAGGTPVTVRTVHPLPSSDSRGLVGFYTAVGWAIAGYLGATLFGLTFSTSPDRRRTAWRLGALSILGLIVGFGGAAVSTAIGGYDQGFFEIGLIGLLTVMATGSVTVALQALFGILGTGIAILLFVVFGNPAAGSAYANELLPGLLARRRPTDPDRSGHDRRSRRRLLSGGYDRWAAARPGDLDPRQRRDRPAGGKKGPRNRRGAGESLARGRRLAQEHSMSSKGEPHE